MPGVQAAVEWVTAHPRLALGLAMAAWASYEFRGTLGHALDGRRGQAWWAAKYLLVVLGGFAAGRLVLAPVWADVTATVAEVAP